MDLVQSALERMMTSELLNWACTSLDNRLLVGGELRLQVGRLLRRFTTDPRKLLGVLDNHRSVISGSVALTMATGDTHWIPGDLDIYMPYDQFLPVVEYMQTNEGYKLDWDKTKDGLLSHIALQVSGSQLFLRLLRCIGLHVHRCSCRTTC